MCLALGAFYLLLALSENIVEAILDASYNALPEGRQQASDPNGLQIVLLTGLAVISFAKSFLIYIGMANVFRKFSTGDVFRLDVVKSIRTLGWLIILYVAISFISTPLFSYFWTMHNPPGEKLVEYSFSTTQGMMLLLGSMFVIIGAIYTQAVTISDENKQYV